MNSITAHGARPTGSAAQARYVKWIRDRLKSIAGVQLSRLDYRISRFTPSSTTLTLRIGKRVRRLAVAGPVPYAKPTGKRGVAGPATVRAGGQPTTPPDPKGKKRAPPPPPGGGPDPRLPPAAP